MTDFSDIIPHLPPGLALNQGQIAALTHALNGRNALAVMPTGSGKSLIYQLLAKVLGETILVISPLIALMNDQMHRAKSMGIRCQRITASNLAKAFAVYVPKGEGALYFCSPEALVSLRASAPQFLHTVNRFVVDEAHCLLEWGFDFRVDYQKIIYLCREFPDKPVLALTATATIADCQEIRKCLGLSSCEFVRRSIERPELQISFQKLPEAQPFESILATLVHELRDENSLIKALIYVRTRMHAEKLAEAICKKGLSARAYHAGLEPEQRQKVAEDYRNGRSKILCATKAFGMGIHIPDIRQVIFWGLPDTVEAFQQGAGRAGRDGQQSRVRIMYKESEFKLLLSYASRDKELNLARRRLQALSQLKSFVASQSCRQRYLNIYFGFAAANKCGVCDNCLRDSAN